MRLIDADRLKQYFDIVGVNEYGCSFSTIDRQPTVDAEPVRRGHIVWKDRFVGGHKYAEIKCRNCGATEQAEVEHPIKTKIGYCSECGKRLDDTFMNYCPNCGAKMEESENVL